MNTKRICVTYGDKSKLVSVNPTEIKDALDVIRKKFSIHGDFKVLAKCDGISKFVDVDPDDEDDVYVFQQSTELLVQTFSEIPGPCSSSSSLSDTIPVASPTPSLSEEDAPTPSPSNKRRVVDIEKLLSENYKGPSILKEYQRNNTLTPQSRRSLVNIVTAGLVESCETPYYPTAKEKTDCAKSIIERFPSLKNRHSKHGYEHFFCAEGKQTGFIQDRLKNMRRHIPENSKKRQHQQPNSSASPSSSPKSMKISDTQLQGISEEEANQLINFCRRATTDLKKDIFDAMKKTFPNRMQWIEDNSPSVTEILHKYPRFIDVDGLVNQDFQMKFGDETSRQLLMQWENIAPSLIKIAKATRTAAICELTSEIEDDAESPINDDLAMYAFLVLVLLLPTHARAKGSRKQTVNQLIDFRPVGTVLEEYLEQPHNHTTKQPYLLCFGTRKSPSQFFIVVDQKAMPCEGDVIAAIDKLFKLHYTFNLKYATDLQLFFTFLEAFVFKLSFSGKVPNKVVEIIAAVESFRSPQSSK